MFLYYTVILIIVIFTIVFGILSIISSFFDKTGKVQHLISIYWGKFILKFTGIKVEVEGLENLNSFDTFVLMPNHQSLYDIPILVSIIPFQFSFLAKESLFRIPILGQHLSTTRHIRIDRSNTRDGVRSLLEGVKKIKEGMSLLIFPEGTRSIDNRIGSFKIGGFAMAIKAGIPIVPITINGSGKIMRKGKKRFCSTRVILIIDPPIETKKYTLKDKNALAEKVRQSILDNWNPELNQ